MTCSSCHHPHNSERNQLATFSQRCMSCHQAGQPGFCKLKNVSAEVLSKNCIDCHMPALASGKITLLTNGQTSPTPDSMRTHLITVYPEEAKRVLARFK
jgi:predicted CXXCH cytochrome family protein